MASIPQPAKTLKLFYSYAHKDERWRKRIEAHLSMLQRQGIIAGWHDRNINAGATWADEIDEHLADADIILLLISPDFLSSDYCYSVEMMKAMERHAAGEARVVPVLLRPTDFKGTLFEHLQFLPSNSQPVSRWQDRDEALLNIVTGIRKMVDELNMRTSGPQPPFDSRSVVAKIAPLSLWGIPYHRNPFFTGREDILTHLHSAFTANKAVIFVQAISGLGGIGKTQIAIEYAYRHREEYTAVLWAKADSREILVSDLVAIAEHLKLPEKDAQDQNRIVDAVKLWLQGNANWLLILDDAEDLAMVREYFPSVGRGHVLLTTRSQATGRTARCIEVGKMKPEEGGLFLLRWANIIAPEDSLDKAPIADQVKAAEISRVMDGLPLALDQAGAYIEETACSLSGYFNLYQKKNAILLLRRGKLISDHPEPVFTTWSQSFERIERANASAADLLRFCAFLHPDSIPEEIIIDGGPELGEALYRLAEDSFELNDAIGELLKFSLVQRDSETNTFSIHRLVQTVIKAGMDEATQRLWADRIVRATNRALPDFELTERQVYQRYLPHIQACVVLIEQLDLVFAEAAQLLYQLGHYFRKNGQYGQAEPLFKRALVIYGQELEPNHPFVTTSIDTLASLYRDQHKFDQAEVLYQRALTLAQETANHISVATSLNNLAELRVLQEKYDEAELLYKQTLAYIEQALGSEHPYATTVLENLTLLFWNQGKYDQAGSLYERVLVFYIRSFSRETSDIERTDTATGIENYVKLSQRLAEYTRGSAYNYT